MYIWNIFFLLSNFCKKEFHLLFFFGIELKFNIMCLQIKKKQNIYKIRINKTIFKKNIK